MEQAISRKRRSFAAIILFAVIGILLYSRVILHGEFLYDDFEYIVDNPVIGDLSGLLHMSDPRQIGYLSFGLNYALGGENPVGYHLFNVMVHIANSLLLYALVGSLIFILNGFQDPPRRHRFTALFAGLIFLVHPVQTQAVSYATQRFTSLATFFYLLSVWLYLAARSRLERDKPGGKAYAIYVFSLVCAVLAMKTKEISFTIPVVLLLFEALVLQGSRFRKGRFIYLIPFAVICLVIPLSLLGPEFGILGRTDGVAEITRQEKLVDLTSRPALPYLFTQFRVIVVYIRALLLPVGLRIVYDFPISYSFWDRRVILSLLLLLTIAGGAVYAWKRGSSPGQKDDASLVYRISAIGIFWFFITLSIESSIIPIKDVIFEHRIYLPSAGFITCCAAVIVHASGRLFNSREGLISAAAPLVLIAVPLSIGTFVRNDVWTGEFKLWDDAVQKSPTKAIGYNNRGMAYAKRGEYQLALRDVDKAISLFPKSPEEQAKWENADINPGNVAKTYVGRGDIQIALGNVEKAREDYRMSKMMMPAPPNIDNRLVLANEYVKRGAYKHAIDIYNGILQGDPEHVEALNDRANTYSRIGRYADAINDFTRITALDPKFVLAYHNRGIAFVQTGKTDRAIRDFETGCALGFPPSCESVKILQQGGE